MRAADGNYLLLVEENQPTLYRDIQRLFDPPPGSAPLPLLERRETRRPVGKGHGRHDGVGQLVVSSDLTGYLDWPGIGPALRLARA